jgi:hypothetical protein
MGKGFLRFFLQLSISINGYFIFMDFIFFLCAFFIEFFFDFLFILNVFLI